LTLNLKLIPRDSPADAGTERLRSRFFGGETSGEAFRTCPSTAAVGDLIIGVNSPQKSFAVALDRLRDTLNLNQVHASPDQHADHITMGSFSVISTFPKCNRKREPWYLFCG
jgi:hypothetical protein